MNQLALSFDTPSAYSPIFSDIQPHIVEKFIDFHKSNPHVYELFKRFAYEARDRWSHFGAKAICERMRWESDFSRDSRDFKLNNNFPACFSRLLVMEDPSFKFFFEFRHTPGSMGVIQ